MRVTHYVSLAMVLVSCSERVAPDLDDAESGTTRSDTTTTTSGTSAANSDSSEAESAVNDASVTGSEASDDASAVAYPDCRPALQQKPSDCVSGPFGQPNAELWSSFACGMCLCAEACQEDHDCIDPGAVAQPRCALSPGGEVSACYLVCEQDVDCPPDMLCLPRWEDDFRVCWWPLLQPQCCEDGGPTTYCP